MVGAFEQAWAFLKADFSDLSGGEGLGRSNAKMFAQFAEYARGDGRDKHAKEMEQEAIDALEFSDVHIIPERLEDIGHDPAFRGRFDIVVARALAGLNVLVELCLPLITRMGWMIAYKSGEYHDELIEARDAIQHLGGECLDVNEFDPTSFFYYNSTAVALWTNYPVYLWFDW